MSTFALDIGASQADLISALNYAIANLGTGTGGSGNVVANIGANVLYVDTVSGQISSNSSGTIGYLYGFVNVKYANSATGSSGFTSNCSMTQYYGVHNTTNGTISNNPVDYSWYQVTGGFGTTKGLYYTNVGGYQAKFNAGTVPPNQFYAPVKDNTAIALITLANSVVTSNSIQPGAVTNVSIASNTIQGQNIQTGTLTGNLIAANTITGNTIQAGTITGNLIQANTITGDLITANTIQGSSIVAGTITSTQIAANVILVANSIQSTNAVFENNTSPGFWLDANTGNVRFGGNTSVGNNLTVGANAVIGGNLTVGANLNVGTNATIGGNATVIGLITAGALNANVVTTNSLAVSSASQIISVADDPATNIINFVNGASQNPTNSNYLWPYNTRGFGVNGGATIIPTTTGSATGSKITVNYNAYVNSLTHPEYNLVELWKNGASQYYKNTFRRATPVYGGASGGYVYLAGDNGALVRLDPLTNVATIVTSTISNNIYAMQNTIWEIYQGGTTYDIYSEVDLFGQQLATSYQTLGPSGYTTWAPRTYVSGSPTVFNINGSAGITQQVPGFPFPSSIFGTSIYSSPTVLVGSNGIIMRGATYIPTPSYGAVYMQADQGFVESSTTFANLNDVVISAPSYVPATSYTPANTGSTVKYVAVGSGGTILVNTRNYYLNGNTATSSGWSQSVTNVTNNLNGIAVNTTGTLYVAVGDGGIILTSTSGTGWTQRVSNTTENLNSIAFCNTGVWVAVGDNGTIITSANGTTWGNPEANPSDGSGGFGVRNLTSVTHDENNYHLVAGGEEVILTSNTASSGSLTWYSPYQGGASYTSQLTRLQYFGSWGNVANVSLPPVQQQLANAQVVSGTYTDINYTANVATTYYVVLGNMFGNVQVYTGGPTINIIEYKR